MSEGYLDLNFDVVQAARKNRYADDGVIRLVNLASIAIFDNYKLITRSGRLLEDISHAHIVALMYKSISSAKRSNDFSIGFNRDRNKRQRELTNNKNQTFDSNLCLEMYSVLLNTNKKLLTG